MDAHYPVGRSQGRDTVWSVSNVANPSPYRNLTEPRFSGEGLVVELTGPGTAFLQTRSQDAFLKWLIPLLPKPQASHS